MYSGGMYATSTGSTTSGSGRARVAGCGAGGGGVSARRVRVLRLVRPRAPAPTPRAFGFSLRGGREHAAGFFITRVEHNSEAHRQGLKVGDQVMSVNGYRVDDAVHGELAHYIANQPRLKIKVRNVGMVPVKEKSHEPLTWKFVSDDVSLASDGTASSSPTLCESERLKDMHLSLLVPHKAKLGCGICKGPEWKPGIFVQFVREHGIARDSGLRAGDQILSCNGIDFSRVQFQEAISAMKRCPRLELRVRPGAGAELVSPESSGYNSSASTHSEHSPHTAHNRLDMVAEETGGGGGGGINERLSTSRLKRRTWDSIDFDWRGPTHSFDAPSDIEPDYDCPSIPNNPHTYENRRMMLSKNEKASVPSNKTIINLTENGATIQCSYDDHRTATNTVSDTTHNRCSGDKKTIVVEVHRGGAGAGGSGSTVAASCAGAATVVSRDLADSSSLSSNTTLSSAIADEISRRKLRKSSESSAPPAAPPAPRKAPLKPEECEKQRQHDALMDEFKKVHRKMFAGQEVQPDDTLDRQQTLALRKSAPPNGGGGGGTNTLPARITPKAPPPPPPPMPETNSSINQSSEITDATVKSNGVHTINGNSQSAIQTVKAGINGKASINGIGKTSLNGTSNGKAVVNGAVDRKKINVGVNGKAETDRNIDDESNDKEIVNKKSNRNPNLKRIPTPDYETTHIETLTAKLKLKPQEETVEVDSIESYKMKNPSSPQPKPPSNYFMRPPNGTATMKKNGRPVSITIGEYPTRALRKQPSKLEFLSGEAKANGEEDQGDPVPIGSRLQSELAMTLSRSNLRKKTELLAKLDSNGNITVENSDESDQAPDKNFHKRYGNNILPTPPQIAIPKVPIVKTNSHPISQHIAMLAGKVAANRLEDSREEAKK